MSATHAARKGWVYKEASLYQYRRGCVDVRCSTFSNWTGLGRNSSYCSWAPIPCSRIVLPCFFTFAFAGIPRDTVSMSTMTAQGLEVLYSRQQIAERVTEMGAQITRDLNGEKLTMVGVLKGAAFFLVDLSRAIEADATFDFVATSSYGKGNRSSGAVKLIKDLDQPIEGKNVLVVEDILDTGLTLAYLRKLFLQQHPKSLRIAALLDKPSRRIEKIEADYVGFSIPNLFVIGYGMDYAERYRNLPDICLMPPGNAE